MGWFPYRITSMDAILATATKARLTDPNDYGVHSNSDLYEAKVDHCYNDW